MSITDQLILKNTKLSICKLFTKSKEPIGFGTHLKKIEGFHNKQNYGHKKGYIYLFGRDETQPHTALAN